MIRILLFTTLISLSSAFAQDKKDLSSASQFIDRSSYVQINIDENEKAIFKSGLGETVEFFPAEIIDLKRREKMYGLNVLSTFITGQRGMNTTYGYDKAWVGIEEIGDLIIWLENYVIPNLEASAGKRKSVTYIFNTNELTIEFKFNNNAQVFSVMFNNTLFPDKYFWTESKVKDIPKVLAVLKSLQAKK